MSETVDHALLRQDAVGGDEIFDQSRICHAASIAGPFPARLTVLAATDLISNAGKHGGSDGESEARTDRTRCVDPRIWMRRGRRADGARQLRRSRARGSARDRARDQLFRHRGDVWKW